MLVSEWDHSRCAVRTTLHPSLRFVMVGRCFTPQFGGRIASRAMVHLSVGETQNLSRAPSY